jgi:hypothetical protein
MIKGFEFAAEGRTYVCTVEERRGTAGEFWWWFTVTGDTSMYAPFQAVSSDTRTSVQERVVAFYNNRVFKRAQPTVRGGQWGRRPPTPAVPVVTPPPSEATA